MKIEKQVCTRDQARKLSELGVKGEPMIYWVDFEGFDESGHMLCRPASKIELESKEGFSWMIVGDVPENLLPSVEEEACGACGNIYPAFSTAELGELLIIGDDDHFCDGHYNDHLGCWETMLHKRDEEAETSFILVNTEEGDTEAEARAEMLIYLIENKILSV